ncbi:MAG: 3D-(3,5/4)-trihydroxycyclohexane-1,2-dione acylhydrolase (decyclizing), partial [Acidobacteria bacterium]|nr:3D-(3,5/4)-trihydroxycyclohexane-1,2-dione acylhydrolase (decyclizing) [Acidobacteriota bacterium]
LSEALTAAREHDRTSVVVIETDINARVPGYESWWDVPVAEVSESESVRAAQESYLPSRRKERYYL